MIIEINMYGHDFTFQHMDMAIHTHKQNTRGKKEKTGNKTGNIDTRRPCFLFPRRKRLETLNGCYNEI